MSLAGYPPGEQRYQMQERARRMLRCRSTWLSLVEDVVFEHEYMGVERIEFNGDYRPADSVEP